MKKLLSYKLTFLVTLLILYAVLMPGDDIPSVGIPGIDKIVHMGMFFTFTAVFSLEYLRCHDRLPHLLPTFLGVLLFALSTELMQGFLTTTRACDIKDLAADMLGMLLAYIGWKLASTYFNTFIEKYLKKRAPKA